MSEMSITLDRFPAPPVEADPVAHCAECGEPMYAGEDALEYEGDYFCCGGCAVAYLRSHDILHTVALGGNEA